MTRIARVVVPGVPYHVTHRGNRRSSVCFTDDHRQVYLALLTNHARQEGLDIWAWCLMTNHIHLIVVPRHEHSIARAIGRTHMQYARRLNRENGWCGHLWANGYHSSPLDDEHLWNAVRYVELNPVRARMVARAEDHPWSSCQEHAGLCEPSGLLTKNSPFPGMISAGGWPHWINTGTDEAAMERIRINTLSGRPCGSEEFTKSMETRLGRFLQNRQWVDQGKKLLLRTWQMIFLHKEVLTVPTFLKNLLFPWRNPCNVLYYD